MILYVTQDKELLLCDIPIISETSHSFSACTCKEFLVTNFSCICGEFTAHREYLKQVRFSTPNILKKRGVPIQSVLRAISKSLQLIKREVVDDIEKNNEISIKNKIRIITILLSNET